MRTSNIIWIGGNKNQIKGVDFLFESAYYNDEIDYCYIKSTIMKELKDVALVYLCFGIGVILAVSALFCASPFNVILTFCGLACMCRVVALAFLQGLSWRVIVFRVTISVWMLAELASFYGYEVLESILGCLVCVGMLISLVNFFVFINKLPKMM